MKMMPIHLRIVIGLSVISIISSLYDIAEYANIANPSSYIMKLAGVIIWIGIVKGLLSRSNISRKFAVGWSVLSLLVNIVLLYLYWTIPFQTKEDFKMAISLNLVLISTISYTIWALLSDQVVQHFITNESKNTSQTKCKSSS